MRKKLFVFCIVSVVLFSVFSLSLFASGNNIESGLWKITTKIKIPNLPPGITLPNTGYSTTICVKKDDDILKGTTKENQCKIIKNQTTGNKSIFEYKCKDSDAHTTVIKGNFKYQKNSFEGDLIVIDPNGQKVHQKMTGKRLGNCK